MKNSASPSIFDNEPKDVYGLKGILSIVYILTIQLFILLYGMVAFAVTLSDSLNELIGPERSPSYFVQFAVYSSYLVLAPVLGAIIRGRFGWILTVSTLYIILGFAIRLFLIGNLVPGAILLIVWTAAFTLMQLPYLNRFYQLEERKPIIHFYAIGLGFAMMLFIASAQWDFSLGRSDEGAHKWQRVY